MGPEITLQESALPGLPTTRHHGEQVFLGCYCDSGLCAVCPQSLSVRMGSGPQHFQHGVTAQTQLSRDLTYAPALLTQAMQRFNRLMVILSFRSSSHASLSFGTLQTRYCAFTEPYAFLLCHGCKDTDYRLFEDAG